MGVCGVLISLRRSKCPGGGTFSGSDPSWINGAVIGFDGNSLTEGQGATAGGDYPDQLYSLLVSAGVTLASRPNFAVGGQTTAQMESDAVTQIDPYLSTGSGAHILFAWEIGNHLAVTGNISTVETAFQNYCAERREAGWKVVVITNPPRNSTTAGYGSNVAAYNTALQTCNTWLRANWTSFADGIVDIAADSRLSDYTNATYYYTDQIHLSNNGYAVVAELAFPVLVGLAH
jgi:hypothetical protein